MPFSPITSEPMKRLYLLAPAGARVAVVETRGLAEADERDEPAQEAVGLVERDDVVDHAPAHQPEVAGVRRDLDVGDALDHAVAERGDDALGSVSPSRVRRCA